MADSKKLSFSTSPKAEQFPPKFHGLVLGLGKLIDAKGIDVAQPIWLTGCLTEIFGKKRLEMVIKLTFVNSNNHGTTSRKIPSMILCIYQQSSY